MFKDYYKILEIKQYASEQEILMAYRTMSIKWSPNNNSNIDVTDMLQDINEAYFILKDKDKCHRYDVEYEIFKTEYHRIDSYGSKINHATFNYNYEIKDESLQEDILEAKRYAKKKVSEYIGSLPPLPPNPGGEWKVFIKYVYGVLILLVVVSMVIFTMNLNKYNKSSSNNQVTEIDEVDLNDENDYASTELYSTNNSVNAVEVLVSYDAPKNWTRYLVGDDYFYISIPPTLELRNEYDAYTKRVDSLMLYRNKDILVFQQKNLSKVTQEAYSHYARVLIRCYDADPGETLRRNDVVELGREELDFFREVVDDEVYPMELLENPTYKWIDINGTKAVEIKYRRTGCEGNTTACSMYLLCDYDKIVKLIVSYREQEEELWLPDMENIIKTFKWK